MIIKETWEKAQNMEVVVVSETNNTLEMIVGYPVTYFKKQEKFVCGCKGLVLYSVPQCAHRITAVLKCDRIPEKFKEALEGEEPVTPEKEVEKRKIKLSLKS